MLNIKSNDPHYILCVSRTCTVYELSKQGDDWMSNIKPLATRMYEITCTKENSFQRKVLFLYQPLISNASWSDDLLWPSCLIRVMSDLWPIHFLTCPFSDLSIRWPVHYLTCPFADLSIRWPVHSLTCTCLIRDLFGRWLHVVQYLYRLSILYVYVSLDY